MSHPQEQTAKELRVKFEADLKALQDGCKHEDQTDWLPYYWAPGHQDGEAVGCKLCDKILKTRGTWTPGIAFTTASNAFNP